MAQNLIWASLFLISWAVRCLGDEIPALSTFSFVPDEQPVLSFSLGAGPVINLTGRSPSECGSASPIFKESEQAGSVALALKNLGQGCSSGVQYANGNFAVRAGVVSSGASSISFNAWEIQPPFEIATSFVASGQQLYMKLPGGAVDHKIYSLRNGGLVEMATVQASSVNPNFTATGVLVQAISEALVVVALPASINVPPLSSMVLSGRGATECSGIVPPSEALGDISLVTMKDSNSKCWTNAAYSNANLLVVRGKLSGSDGSLMTAYKIYPPAIRSTSWTASSTGIYVRSVELGNITLRSFDGRSFIVVETLTPNRSYFTRTGAIVDQLTQPMIFIISPSSQRVSVWHEISNSLDAACVAGCADPKMAVVARRFLVGGRPFVPESDWAKGPGTHDGNYGTYKKFFPVRRNDGREGVVWQDEDTRAIRMTWFALDLGSAETVQLLENSDGQQLVAAASNGKDEIAFIIGSSVPPSDKKGHIDVYAVKFNITSGVELLRTQLDTTAAALNIYALSSSGASMAWDTLQSDTIAVVLARTMTQGSDGSNHQGAIAIILSEDFLNVTINHGQTSGHSFANSLLVSRDGSYVGMDLGDNYPRGVNVWRFNGTSKWKKSRVVYSFKTRHSTSPGSQPYPIYTEISTADTTYYRWSNDNYVYTELAHPGIVETADGGLLVFFSGETPSLDNSKVGFSLNSARNLGFVKVPKDLTSSEVLSLGPVETGGYYTFGGGWINQTIKGINFLTAQTDIETSVSRPKTAVLPTGEILVLWELWSRTDFNRSEYMVVDQDGAVLHSESSIDYPLRLPIADDLTIVGGHAVGYAGTMDGQIVRYEICVDGKCRAAATLTTTMASSEGNLYTTTAGLGSDVSINISGNLTILVGAAEAVAFVNNKTVRDALKRGIATTANVPENFVTVNMLRVANQGRRLESLDVAIEVGFVIFVPANSDTGVKRAASQAMIQLKAGDEATLALLQNHLEVALASQGVTTNFRVTQIQSEAFTERATSPNPGVSSGNRKFKQQSLPFAMSTLLAFAWR